MFVAVVLAVLVGTALGLFGGGGAVLAVPIFVYVLGVPVKSAIPMSFLVVGTASATGALLRWRSGELDPARGVSLGVAAVAGALVGARIAVGVPPRIQLLLFASAVLLAGISLFRSASAPTARQAADGRASTRLGRAFGLVAFALIGVFTAIVGIGGGFLFVPTLVALFGIPMLEAAGLSLVVIAMNAAAALAGYSGRVAIDWQLALLFTGIVVAAMIPGTWAARRVPEPALRRAFATLLLLVGALVFYDNIR